MKIKFNKNVVAFGKDNNKGDIIDVDDNHIDVGFCLSNGWIEEYKKRVISKNDRKVMKRKHTKK